MKFVPFCTGNVRIACQSFRHRIACAALLVSAIFAIGCDKPSKSQSESAQHVNRSGSEAIAILENRSAVEGQKPNVLLIVVDTLAALHTTVYAPESATTPNLQQLASNGLVFERAYSAAPWTKPALASLFTSLYPREHGVQSLNSRLSARHNTLAELLQAQGYHTAGVVSHTLLKKGNGYEQGFASYEIVPFEGNVHDSVTSQLVSQYGLRQLGVLLEDSQPFLLFLHYFDPHFNYQHHEKFDRSSGYKGKIKPGMGFRKLRAMIPKMIDADKNYLVDLYREEIQYTDEQLGLVFDALRAKGVFDDTLIIVTADHGEEFLEHGGLGHTRSLYDELIRVPLIVSWPKHLRPGRVSDAVSTMDILPALAAVTGVPADSSWHGRSIFDPRNPQRVIFAEVNYKSSGIRAWKTGALRGSEKLIFDHLKSKQAFFNIATDPQEQKNLLEHDSEAPSVLSDALRAFLENPASAESEDIEHSKEELEQLRSLGYL